MKIGVLSNPFYPETGRLADEIRRALVRRGIEARCSTAEGEEVAPRLGDGLDVLITLGGDGTMLRAARLHAPNGTPILGIHMGRLGFLAEVRQGDWEASLDRVCQGDYWVEERTMVRCRLERGADKHGPWEAVNEVVVGRCGQGHMAQLATYVDAGYFTTYVADGLIVATATGSTAYALSAGGPILPPELPNLVLVPICPHLSLDRTIVLAAGATVTVRVEAITEGAIVVDGVTEMPLHEGDQVHVAKSPYVARFVRLYDRRQVYETLMERLQPRKVDKPDDGH
ncbi:MAG: NAD(+)/NADH kinase [Anaerolineae bacterium]|nr:NAD(+)/NADH kinase [Anaerolineae bacterium]